MEKQNKKVLWITNMMPGFVALKLGLNGTNKEGWIEGTARKIQEDNHIQLAIAFPINDEKKCGLLNGNSEEKIKFYGFLENTNSPEIYDADLENRIEKILDEYNPDVIHVFGTEFPHTLALMKLEKWIDKVLIHIQGVMEECYKVYAGNIPKYVIDRVTFRDFIRKDSIKQQLEKYRLRANNEHEALVKVKHVLGRTEFDKKHINKINPACEYHKVNETLRKSFYENEWVLDTANKHEIFVSQGNYPLKGVHKVIEAVAIVKEKYPDVKLYISGDKITAFESIKDKIKISSYGKYLRELIKKNNLEDSVIFTGSLNEDDMLKRFLKSEIFILSSFVENSPNSLGEAMLLGVPSIAANVGGVSSLAVDKKDVLMYEPNDEKALAKLIETLFDSSELKETLSDNARKHARVTHDEVQNYNQLMFAYNQICNK